MNTLLLETIDLTKQYKKQKAVNTVSLHLERGAIYGFIGKNGAGKTTFLKMISGLAKPTSGQINFYDEDGNEIQSICNQVGTLIENPGLYPNLTAYGNLELKAICIGKKDKNYINEILEFVGLGNVGKKKVKNYSLGMKQRLGIAMALIGDPKLLILDEPINGLDPQGIAEVRETILKLNEERGITVIISSHILEELSKLVTHYGIIDHGKLLEEMTKEQLMDKCNNSIKITLEQPELACDVLKEMGISNFQLSDNNTIKVLDHLDMVADINKQLALKGILVQSIGVDNENLEEYFIHLTGGVTNA